MTTQAIEAVLLTVEEAAVRLRIGRTTMYALVSSGAVESVKVGRLRRVPVEAVDAYVTVLRTTASNPPKRCCLERTNGNGRTKLQRPVEHLRRW
jgi:excisionase family DNA binding protein